MSYLRQHALIERSGPHWRNAMKIKLFAAVLAMIFPSASATEVPRPPGTLQKMEIYGVNEGALDAVRSATENEWTAGWRIVDIEPITIEGTTVRLAAVYEMDVPDNAAIGNATDTSADNASAEAQRQRISEICAALSIGVSQASCRPNCSHQDFAKAFEAAVTVCGESSPRTLKRSELNGWWIAASKVRVPE